jgi:hypothetical protein
MMLDWTGSVGRSSGGDYLLQWAIDATLAIGSDREERVVSITGWREWETAQALS